MESHFYEILQTLPVPFLLVLIWFAHKARETLHAIEIRVVKLETQITHLETLSEKAIQ